MKTITSRIGCIAAILALVFGSIGTAAEPAAKPVVDFSEDAAAGKWLSINDGVMGGVSEGGFRFTSNKTLVFSGKISLENRGGFASIRTRPADLDLDGYDTIAVRVKGDGRTYYLNLRTSSRRVSGSYRAPVKTKAETWQEVRVPLGDFKYTAFGRRVGARPPEASKIRSVGFTLADKQAGPFRLEVAWIRALKSEGAENPAAAVKTESSAGPQDIVDTAVGAGSFKTLVAAVKAAGLVDTLKGPGPFTVFAPTDDAFAKLPKGTVASLLKPENQGKLVAILTYHVVAGKVLAADVVKVDSAKTVNGKPLPVKVQGGSVFVGTAKVVKTDIECSNGVIHVIDSVLLPPAAGASPTKDIVDTAVGAGSFKTLVAAVKAAGLVDTLKGPGPFTVFAPTDDAFAKLPKGTVASLLKPENQGKLVAILTYHVVPGRLMAADVVKAAKLDTVQGSSLLVSTKDGVKIDNAGVVKTDIKTSNGVIHVIDSVLLPQDIVAKAQTAGLFKTLLAAAKAARLVGALKNPDAELTVFAPTDDAFAKLPKGTVATLLKPENKAKLAAILKYHVLPRRVLLGPYEAPTLEGGSVSIRPEPGTHVNGAKVVLADVKTTNGVVHVIDTVLLPPEKPAAGHEAARKMIEDAINRGAPLYNAGHPKACADLYEKTMRTLLAQHGAALGDYGRRRFRKALNRMSTTHGHRSQAWLLRNALDAVHLHLAGLH